MLRAADEGSAEINRQLSRLIAAPPFESVGRVTADANEGDDLHGAQSAAIGARRARRALGCPSYGRSGQLLRPASSELALSSDNDHHKPKDHDHYDRTDDDAGNNNDHDTDHYHEHYRHYDHDDDGYDLDDDRDDDYAAAELAVRRCSVWRPAGLASTLPR